MKFNCEAVVLGTKERFSKEGKAYHDINLDQNGEILTLSCTDEVYKSVGSTKYVPFKLELDYTKSEFDGRVYTRFGVTAASPVK